MDDTSDSEQKIQCSPKTSVALESNISSTKRKKVCSEPEDSLSLSETMARADDRLFKGGRELWLAKRLADPEIFIPLQANKKHPAPPEIRYRTKSTIYRHLAFEFNQQKEHAGYLVDDMKIKNKIAKMSLHFKAAHQFRYFSGLRNMDEATWRDAIRDRYDYYFILEPAWASIWGEGISTKPGSIIDPVNIKFHSAGVPWCHSDGSLENNSNSADTGSGHGQICVDVTTTTEDASPGNTTEKGLDRSQMCDTQDVHPSTTLTASELRSQKTFMSHAFRGEEHEGDFPKERSITALIELLNKLIRYEIDARKEVELAEVESRKKIRLAELDIQARNEKTT